MDAFTPKIAKSAVTSVIPQICEINTIITDELMEYSIQRKLFRLAANPAAYRGKNCGLATMKCASAEIPKKRATAGPIRTLNIVTGAAKVDPGGPDMYVAFTGNEKSLASAMTAIICRRWKIPAMRLNRRRRNALNSFAIPTLSVELSLDLVD